jgi:hypothetical protein
VNQKFLRTMLALSLAASLVIACGTPRPTPTVEPIAEPSVVPTRIPKPTAEPTATPMPPLLNVTLSTDSAHYEPSRVAMHLTLINHGDQPVYLPICGPWSIIRTGTKKLLWFMECEVDYLGHKVDPGQIFADSLSLYLQAGSYEVGTEVYGDCILGEPKSISAKETYYGEFDDCAIWQEIVSESFGVE